MCTCTSLVASLTQFCLVSTNLFLIHTGVELLVKETGWSERNNGRLYFRPEELHSLLLLVVKVYPENTPFEKCHIVRSKTDNTFEITKTFFPENTDVNMNSYDNTFLVDYRGSSAR